MPNYIRNRIKIIGTFEQVQEVFDKFNTHIPMKVTNDDGFLYCKNKENNISGTLNPYTGHFWCYPLKIQQQGLPEGWEIKGTPAFDFFPDFDKVIPQPEDIGEDWYFWNRENWGTKWNAMNVEREKLNVFTFETAWDGVPIIIEEMSRQCPEVVMEYEFADEDLGYNCAEFIFKAGELLNFNKPKEGSKDAYDISFRLFSERKDDFILVGDKYQYKDLER